MLKKHTMPHASPPSLDHEYVTEDEIVVLLIVERQIAQSHFPQLFSLLHLVLETLGFPV